MTRPIEASDIPNLQAWVDNVNDAAAAHAAGLPYPEWRAWRNSIGLKGKVPADRWTTRRETTSAWRRAQARAIEIECDRAQEVLDAIRARVHPITQRTGIAGGGQR